MLIPFGELLIADVLLYAYALMLEFGALIALRRKEPDLRGAFRIPGGRGFVIALASVPLGVLAFVMGVSFRDGQYGLPAVLGALAASGAGLLVYPVMAARRRRS